MIQQVSVFITVFIFLEILIKFKPPAIQQEDRELLTKKYKAFDILLLVGFLFSLPFNAVIVTLLLERLSDLELAVEPKPAFLIKQNSGTWFVIGIFSALGISTSIYILIVRLAKKKLASEYWRYYNLKYGFNASKLLKYLAIGILLVVTIFTSLTLNSNVKVFDESISINGIFDITPTKYDLNEVVEITEFEKAIAPNGKVVEKKHHSLKFTDGRTWRTTDDMRSFTKKDSTIIKYLLDRTNLVLKRAEIDEK
ncbi:hypothetical protein [Reichenbachiella sp. MSK19-1]|uniref:hypothetical protein n=1 Tax=Reichenbachiella sp. MSK19-1 TaxID=1897631 RepID=UPI000E6CB96F|nr:hypothetical protein [Reichenbachiella sp. MSK19-1]RJE72764.1 hypothetical protein BGP76_02055 [Reichenbachiella sp. MSK19-1]